MFATSAVSLLVSRPSGLPWQLPPFRQCSRSRFQSCFRHWSCLPSRSQSRFSFRSHFPSRLHLLCLSCPPTRLAPRGVPSQAQRSRRYSLAACSEAASLPRVTRSARSSIATGTTRRELLADSEQSVLFSFLPSRRFPARRFRFSVWRRATRRSSLTRVHLRLRSKSTLLRTKAEAIRVRFPHSNPRTPEVAPWGWPGSAPEARLLSLSFSLAYHNGIRSRSRHGKLIG